MIRVAAVFAALAVVVTGCQVGEDPTASKGSKSGAAGGSSTEKDAATSVTDWLTAAVDLDGKKYCGQLTVDLQEQLTGSQSDQATQRCERAVSSAVAGRLPLRIAVVAEEAGSQTANVNLASEVPQKADLLKEQGSFKIDDAGESAKEGEDPGGRPGSTQEEKDAEEAVKTLIKAAIDEDGKTYCSQLTTRATASG